MVTVTSSTLFAFLTPVPAMKLTPITLASYFLTSNKLTKLIVNVRCRKLRAYTILNDEDSKLTFLLQKYEKWGIPKNLNFCVCTQIIVALKLFVPVLRLFH